MTLFVYDPSSRKYRALNTVRTDPDQPEPTMPPPQPRLPAAQSLDPGTSATG